MREDEKSPEEAAEELETKAEAHIFDPLHELPPVEGLGYEVRDFLGRRAAIFFGVLLFVSVALVLWLSAWLHNMFVAGAESGAPTLGRAEVQPPEPPAPIVQAEPEVDLAELRGREEAALNRYGWVDREAKVVHIPIERAIELTAERGLPSRKEPQAQEGAND